MTFREKILKYLSLASLSIGAFNTINNQTTIQSLRDNLDKEKEKNSKLISEINKLAFENSEKIENILNKNIEINDINNTKLNALNNKISQIIENKNYSNNSISEVEDVIKDINNDLTKIIDKLDESLKNSFINTDIFNVLQSYYENLNYFQTFALTHLSGFIFIALSLISLISLYIGDYLIEKYQIKEKYPRIYKFIELRRKFQRFYLILDITIIFIILIILSILNIMMFINFTL